MGDARLSLATAPQRGYDLLVVDAFSSDAIPIHLLTREAMHLYLEKLAEGGMLAFHISNRYLDLEPVLGNLAVSEGLIGVAQSDKTLSDEEKARRKTPSVWAVLARQRDDLGPLADHAQWHALVPRPGMAVWTDDFSNILSVFHIQ
jgi:hypothetical protein